MGDLQWEYDELLGQWTRKTHQNVEKSEKRLNDIHDSEVTQEIDITTAKNKLEYRKGAKDKENWDQQWEYDELLGQWYRRDNSMITKQILPDAESYNFIHSDQSNSIDGYKFEDGRYDEY